MTAPLRGTPRPSALPASQSAPVAEFRCLFTHDLRRKQKRWQDGFLKFHTFNSRVMVYDQVRNHVGDTYWKESNELQEGDELSLDRGIMVEVAEALGITQTDLTPLFEKKSKEQIPAPPAPSRPLPASTSVRPYQRPTPVAPAQIPRNGTQLRHKSLNTLLGPSKGAIGKAMPMKSPFETRKEQENEWADGPAAKRQKVDKRPGTWRASSPVEEQPSPMKVVAKPRPAVDRPRSVPQKSNPSDIVDLSSEPDIPEESDVTLPSPPSGYVPRTKVLPPPRSIPKAPKLPPTPRHAPIARENTTPRPPPPPSSPPVSASNRLSNVDVAFQATKMPMEKPAPPKSPTANLKAKSLRLSVGVRRGTMLCQSLPQPSSRIQSWPRISRVAPAASKISQKGIPRIDSLNPITQSPTRPSSKRKSPPAKAAKQKKKAKAASSPIELSEDPFENPELVHGMMDQKLLVSPLPAKQPSNRQTKADRSRASAVAKATEQRSSPDITEHVNRTRSPTPVQAKATRPKPVKKASPEREKQAQEEPRNHSILAAAYRFEPPAILPREVSPAHSEASSTRSRTGSTSPAKALFSAGGFRKKQKSAQRASESPAPDCPAPVTRNETVILPPHPLRASKKGHLLTATELASRLQKPKKRQRADDPIEENSQPPGKSPNRSFRRVRSENDAPLPSTAQDWEKKNLPKASSDLTDLELGGVAPPAPKRPKPGGLAALVKKTDPRKKFARTQSLTVDTNTASVAEPELPSPVIDNDVGPWSTEAFDLFDWRPPNRDINVDTDG